MAVVAAAFASSVLGFLILLLLGPLNGPGVRNWAKELPVILAIVTIWAPAFALIPAGILGWVVERPKARAAIRRPEGGFVSNVVLSMAAAAVLWLLFRTVLYVANSTPRLMDAPSLALFALIGLCSGISWWILVIVPGRRG